MIDKLKINGKYAAYLRKSRVDMEAEARGEEDTYIRHKRILFDLSKHLGITIAKIYQEAPISGESISERPEMIDLLEDVEDEQWDGILVVEVERLARGDTMDQGTVAKAFKYSDTLIITPMRTYDPTNPDDEEYFEFGLFMSRREFKTINRRLQRGRLTSVEEGKFVGNIPPYGYNRKKMVGKKGWTLEPNPDEAPILQLIFALYTDPDPDKRMGSSLICDYLNNVLRAPTREGGEWIVATIRDILTNPHCIGMVRWGHRRLVKKRNSKSRPRAAAGQEKRFKGLHPALISHEQFELAQSIMKGNTHVRIVDGKVKNSLAGLVQCGVCGKAMVRRPYKDIPDALICSKQYCVTKSSYIYLVEEKLISALKEWLKKYRAQWEKGKPAGLRTDELKIKTMQAALDGLRKQLDKLTKQRSNLHDLLEQGVYSVDVFMERSIELKHKSDEIEANIVKLQKETKIEGSRITAKKEIIPKLKEVIALYPKATDPGQKNELLRSVIDSIIYTKEVGGRWSGAEDHFTLVINPKLPK